jgi:hypothetical protein
MANCSFLKATDARSRSRNDTLIWTEICEVQQAILAAIDAGTSYSTIVNDGTPFTSLNAITAVSLDAGGAGYTISPVEGLTGVNPDNGATYTNGIYANGTGGTGAAITPVVTGQVITSVTIDSGGSGYTPVSATASVGVLYDLLTAQDETSYDNSPTTEGTFVGGDDYAVGEVITLSESSTATVDAISATGVVTIAAQDETSFDNSPVTEGTFVGGNANPFTPYIAAQTITMNDGTVILVDAVDGNGDVTEFTIQSISTVSVASGTTLVQASTTGAGAGFTLTLDTDNETAVGVVTQFTIGSAGAVPFRYPATITQASTTGIGVGFTLSPDTDNVQPVTTGSGAILTPIVTNGVITSVVINNGGTAYLGQEPIIFSHPSGTSATAFVSAINTGTGAVTGITVSNGGSGYEVANPLVEVSHPSGTGFVGTVNTTGGVITSVSVQDGGFGYQTLYPTVTVSDATGSGAQINVTGVSAGAITSIQLAAGGSGYSQTPSTLIYNSDGVQNATATISLTVGSNTYGTNPTDYYAVLSGQATDAVIADQIQYVLDYFTALGYNIRAQVNPATGDTMQWQIIW